MGCWNGTCGLTQLPIMAGEKVVCYILIESQFADEKGGSGFCYPKDVYKPVAIPFVAEYNDYGSIENVEKGYGFILNDFKELVKEGKLTISGDRMNGDSSMPRSLSGFIDAISERRVYSTRDGKYLGIMMVHKELHDLITSEMGNRKPYKHEKTLKELWEETVDTYVTERIESKALLEQLRTEPDKEVLVDKVMKLMQTAYDNKLTRVLSDFGVDYGSFTKMYLTKLDNPKIRKAVIDFILMETVLNYSRKMWMIQCGAGSQGQEYYLNKVMADWVVKQESKRVQEYLEEVEEEHRVEDITQETAWWF